MDLQCSDPVIHCYLTLSQCVVHSDVLDILLWYGEDPVQFLHRAGLFRGEAMVQILEH